MVAGHREELDSPVDSGTWHRNECEHLANNYEHPVLLVSSCVARFEFFRASSQTVSLDGVSAVLAVGG